MKIDVKSIFYITAATVSMCMIVVIFSPRVSGHQSDGNRVSIRELFHDKLLILFMLFCMIAQVAISFYQTFFPLYFESIGGNKSELGIIYFMTALSELPFLFFAERIIRKLGIQVTLILSMGAIALRSLLIYIIDIPSWVYPMCLLHGMTFIVFAYSVAVYINKTVKKELRASGQTMLGFIGMGIGRILGSILGGFSIEAFGIQNSMLYTFIMCILSAAAFIIIGSGLKKRNGIILMTPPQKY